MGRKSFMRDLDVAIKSQPPDLDHIRSHEEGLVAAQFTYVKDRSRHEIGIRLLATDVDEYPNGNTYMLFTEDDNVAPLILSTFDILTPLLHGKMVQDALAEVSRGLTTALSSTDAHKSMPLDREETEAPDFEDGDFADDFADDDADDLIFGFRDSQIPQSITRRRGSHISRHPLGTQNLSLEKLRDDLKAAKSAGFRIGILGDPEARFVICVSIRITKLGISEEAIQAWGLRRTQYLVVMILFQQGYRDLDQLKEVSTLEGGAEMQVGLCEYYKPTFAEALLAFKKIKNAEEVIEANRSATLEQLFIGRPLNDLLRERFTKIVKFRQAYGFTWVSAEAFVNDIQGKDFSSIDAKALSVYYGLQDHQAKTLPSVVTADSLEGKLPKNMSLPLVAMQFILRHFVRCTEFCLVCHCKVGDTFEALKPYVCSRPLCLWQYMTYGFGPSIEWELLSQPYVVDLLVSFCYAAARQGKLKDFPIGIDLKIPFLPHYSNSIPTLPNIVPVQPPVPPRKKKSKENAEPTQGFDCQLSYGFNELIFSPSQAPPKVPLRVGEWVVVRLKSSEEDMHYRIEEVMLPVLRLGDPVIIKTKEKLRPAASSQYAEQTTPDSSRPSTPANLDTTGLRPCNCYRYDQRFDGLNREQMHNAIANLLETLPPVLEMQKFLEKQSGQDPSLRSWAGRISESALNLLRWIIASNRSCILQGDRLVHEGPSSKLSLTSDDRVGGMDSWMQFRFAQGAPDKEQRFIDCVKKEGTAAHESPTLFAWHGSKIGSWHSIVREGLRFDTIENGRANGNGIYMSPSAQVSLGYCHHHYQTDGTTWPQSVLKITYALSLNEVVNKPAKFVCQTPHYVVNNVDWVQTRYLFVKSVIVPAPSTKSIIEYKQDQSRKAINEAGKTIKIPITAISKSRRLVDTPSANRKGNKKSKTIVETDQETAERDEDDANSVTSDEADVTFLEPDSEYGMDSLSIQGDESAEAQDDPDSDTLSSRKKRAFDQGLTDFTPGTLDMSRIKVLQPPKDATSMSSKALMQAFRAAIKVQASTPLHDLGWYIEPERVENMYQWIVELHSFNENLPLAQDMKVAGVTSIVMEMRFTSEFPFSPPFIRVVSPRFLPFQQGGGGHVTEGGAICMELLTNSGWSAVNTMESVLLQVRLEMTDEERPARLAAMSRGGRSIGRADSYSVGEAITAYQRACRAHGWKVPEGFDKFQFQY